MADRLYVCLQDEDKIACFAIDPGTGGLTRQADVPVAGGPSVTALSPDRRMLYVGLRTRPAISASHRSRRGSAECRALSRALTRRISSRPTAPAGSAVRLLSGRLCRGASARIGRSGRRTCPRPYETGKWRPRDRDRSVQSLCLFVPHIARLQDNVLEPPKNNPGPNFIAQFRFDAESGRPTPNSQFRVEQRELVGPRHYCFHPSLDLVYFSDEQGCSVSAYRLDRSAGTLSAVQTHQHAARRVFRTEHLLAAPPDCVGEIPLCRQPRPQQYRGFQGRPRGPADRGRTGADRGGPQRLRIGSGGKLSVRGRHGYRKAGILPHRWRDRRADAAGDPELGPAPAAVQAVRLSA